MFTTMNMLFENLEGGGTFKLVFWKHKITVE